ncbi:CBO2463/CBO2479 domain-containing protein [Agathobacter sp.]|uniref:CBO2463/CBO2479 domain-containing protein n=1 Tax=Agathobacter sp. TaxID=2021311 RepID=UPI003FD88FDA
MTDYIINPIRMGGLVKEVDENQVKVHLHGRLGVITVPKRLVITSEELTPGHEMEFYFSYIQIMKDPYDYDSSDMTPDHDIAPCLLGGKISEVNDTAIKVDIMDHLGTIAVPRRWAFTPVPLENGQDTEFYFSCMKVIGKRDIPVESI